MSLLQFEVMDSTTEEMPRKESSSMAEPSSAGAVTELEGDPIVTINGIGNDACTQAGQMDTQTLVQTEVYAEPIPAHSSSFQNHYQSTDLVSHQISEVHTVGMFPHESILSVQLQNDVHPSLEAQPLLDMHSQHQQEFNEVCAQPGELKIESYVPEDLNLQDRILATAVDSAESPARMHVPNEENGASLKSYGQLEILKSQYLQTTSASGFLGVVEDERGFRAVEDERELHAQIQVVEDNHKLCENKTDASFNGECFQDEAHCSQIQAAVHHFQYNGQTSVLKVQSPAKDIESDNSEPSCQDGLSEAQLGTINQDKDLPSELFQNRLRQSEPVRAKDDQAFIDNEPILSQPMFTTEDTGLNSVIESVGMSMPDVIAPVSMGEDAKTDGGKLVVDDKSTMESMPFSMEPVSIGEEDLNGLLKTSNFPAEVENTLTAVGMETSTVGNESDKAVAASSPNEKPFSNGEIQDDKQETEKHQEYHGEGAALIGSKVQKRFGRKLYTGSIIAFDPETTWYKVAYEDGDEEDLWWRELEPVLLPPSGVQPTPASKKRHRAGVTPDAEQKSDGKRLKTRSGEKISSVKMESKEPGISRENKGTERQDAPTDETVMAAVEDTQPQEQVTDMQDDAHRDLKFETDPTQELLHSEEKPDRRKSEQKARRGRKRKSEAKTNGKHVSKVDGETSLTETKRLTRRSSTGSEGANAESLSHHTPRPKRGASEAKQEGIALSVEKKTPGSVISGERKTLEINRGIKLVGRKTKKDFGGSLYSGEIISYDSRARYYKVRYEDGDEEELEWNELQPTLLPIEEQANGHVTPLRPSKSVLTPHSGHHADKGSSRKGDSARVESRSGRKSAGTLERERGDRHDERGSTPASSLHRVLEVVRFASISDAESLEFHGWGEVTGFDRGKCPEIQAAKLLPTSSPIVHMAASQHHLAAITAAGQVWVWRNKHGNIYSRTNEWEHIPDLDNKNIIIVDIAGPEIDRSLGGYEPSQEDQVPDPFYLVAVSSNGEDYILQGSQPQEPVRTYRLSADPQYPGLKAALEECSISTHNMGKIVQASVGTVEAADEPPFIGYITDTDRVYIRSATRDFMEEVNDVSGFSGRPLKIECGRAYHAIIMTDDGKAWTWGRGYFPGANTTSSTTNNFSVCQPALGTLVGRKVIDVGCYGEDFIALTDDGDVHQWTHALPNPAHGVYNVPATPFGKGPSLSNEDRLKRVAIGAGMCAGISKHGRVHTWRSNMKGGFAGIVGPELEALTPLGRDEQQADTTLTSLGSRDASKVICVARSLIVIVHRRSRGRWGPRKKPDLTQSAEKQAVYAIF